MAGDTVRAARSRPRRRQTPKSSTPNSRPGRASATSGSCSGSSRLLHRVRRHLLRAGPGDAAAATGRHHRADGGLLPRPRHDHQIGFGILILIVGGAGVANGIVMYHMKRMSVGSALAYAYMASWRSVRCRVPAGGDLLPHRDVPPGPRSGADGPALRPRAVLLCRIAGLLHRGLLALAIAILYDRNRSSRNGLPTSPIWQIVTEILAVPVFILKSGPFAWNGSIAFWEGTVIFGIWISCLIVLLKKANELQPTDEAPLP